ncbi:MAG: hypothetical protein AB7K24_22990, partial [Gemmataceae bacterium]
IDDMMGAMTPRLNMTPEMTELWYAGNSMAGGIGLIMTPLSATLLAGPSSTGPFIKVSPTGITLQYAPGIALNIGPAGVTMEYMTSKVSASVAGVEMAAVATEIVIAPTGTITYTAPLAHTHM